MDRNRRTGPVPGQPRRALPRRAGGQRSQPGDSSREDARSYFEQFARVANVERKDLAASRRGYAAYGQLDAAAAVRAYAVAGSAFDNAEDLARLVADATRADLEQAEVENLRLALLAAEMSQTASRLRIVNSSLDEWLG